MKRRPLPSPQSDLFGQPRTPPRDTTPVTLAMQVVGPGTDKAWFLRPRGVAKGAPGFAPRSECRPGVGPSENLFTMPRWLARERGWL